MCGIAGIISSNPRLVSSERVRKGVSVLDHRGPEQQGEYITETCALGHNRLCIIDLSPGASQPFHINDRYHLVYNGEIYNYKELKQSLTNKGFHFETSSDTEVVLACYVVYGKDCVKHLDGMFAFAVWDSKEKHLFAARDRFGEKPFFYYYDGEQLLFASEIKAFWAMGISKEVNHSMLYNFISIGYTSNPSDPQETFYQNINKLPAASILTFNSHQQELMIEKYWQFYPEINYSIRAEDAEEKLLYLLKDSVSKRLRADVPVGTSLSGGLDSSTIVALCSDEGGENYSHKCFTAGFPGFEKDESHYAKRVADLFKLEHYQVTISQDEVVSLMDKLMWHQEEPVASSSPLAQFKVYEAARKQGVKVVLDGQGADELLAGYSKYYVWYWQELFRKNQLNKSGEIQAARALGVKNKFGLKEKVAALLPDFSSGIWTGKKTRLASKHPDLNKEFAFSHKRDLYYTLPALPDLNSALYFNSFVYGLEELLRLADRNSMAHSVEVRLPFLQAELVEFIFSLPPSFKIKNGWTKWILRRVMSGSLPEEIVWRKDKVGYEPPQKIWMQDKKVQERMMAAKTTLANENILDSAVVHKKIQPHDAHAAESRDWRYWSAAYLFVK